MKMIELQEKFAVLVAGRMKSAWDEIRIHYENAPVATRYAALPSVGICMREYRNGAMSCRHSPGYYCSYRFRKPLCGFR